MVPLKNTEYSAKKKSHHIAKLSEKKKGKAQ